MKIEKTAKNLGWFLLALTVFLSLWMTLFEAIRLVFGGFYVLFVPGLVMTYAFFEEKELSFLERFPFAFGLSLVTVSLTVFNLLRVGMVINPWTILAVVTGLSLLAGGIFFTKQKKVFFKS